MRRRVQAGRAPHLRGEAQMDGQLVRLAQQCAHQGHLPLVLGERETLMAVTHLKTEELEGWTVSCDGCNYTIEEDDDEITVFDNPEAGIAYATDSNWKTAYTGPVGLDVRCPGCERGEN
jgi:hypothetical protein